MILYLLIGSMLSLLMAEIVGYKQLIEIGEGDKFIAFIILGVIAMAWPLFIIFIIYYAKNKS